MDSPTESLGMGFVENFGHAMIEAFLEEDGLHYLRDREGDFLVQFGYDEEIDGHPRFLLATSGEDQEQFCLRGDTLQRIARSDWDRVLRLCNEWNALYKMPKVYLEIDDPNASATGRIVCEQWLDLEPGIHQELINHVSSTFFLPASASGAGLSAKTRCLRSARRPPTMDLSSLRSRAGPDDQRPLPRQPLNHQLSDSNSRDRPVVGTVVVRPLPGAFALQPGLLVKVEVKLLLDFGEDLIAPAEHRLRCDEKLL